jgi:hypothetical protein
METQYLMRAVMALMDTDLPVVVCPSEDYDEIHWCEVPQGERPSKSAVAAEVKRLRAEDDATAYRRQRAVEYPPIGDQLDDLLRQGAFSDEMQARLLAVKARYPKDAP